jgi:hypothetical protein
MEIKDQIGMECVEFDQFAKLVALHYKQVYKDRPQENIWDIMVSTSFFNRWINNP